MMQGGQTIMQAMRPPHCWEINYEIVIVSFEMMRKIEFTTTQPDPSSVK
jgi:hypothetical protein